MQRKYVLVSATLFSLVSAGCSKKDAPAAAGAAASAVVSGAAAPAAVPGASPKLVPVVSQDPDKTLTVTATGKIDQEIDAPAAQFMFKHMGNKPIRAIIVGVYGYDKAGKVAGYTLTTLNTQLAPGETYLSAPVLEHGDTKVKDAEVTQYEIEIRELTFADKSEWKWTGAYDGDGYERPLHDKRQ